MSPRLDWRVGPDGGEDALIAARPEAVLPRRTRRRLALTPGFLSLYLAALLCAGWVGFGLGRWSESRAAVGAELARQMVVETAAWRGADADLLRSTLDPEAPAAWQQALVAALDAAGPVDYAAEIAAFEVLGADRARATVQVTTADGRRMEERLYRAVAGTWYRSP